MQTIYFLGSIMLLIVLIVALIIIMVLRDQRELKTKQIAAQLSQLEEVVADFKKIKDELATANVSYKKHEATLSQALAQADGRLRQVSPAGANTEIRPQPAGMEGTAGAAGMAGTNRERQDDKRDRERGPGQKGKTWGGGRPDNRRREYSGASGEAGETVTINDGEKYAKVTELASHGLSAQEIAKRLNVGADEVSLVLELKSKK